MPVRAIRITRLRLTLLCLFACAAVAPQAVFAHRLPPEVVAYFAIDPRAAPRLRVAVRVPTALLLDAGLPRVETVLLDLRTIDTRLGAVAAEVARSLDVTDAGQPLTPGPARWMVSVLGDRAFESFDLAMARFADAPVPVDSAVYWNEAYVDVQFDYQLATATPRIEARLNGLRMGGDFFRTRATFIPASGARRTVEVMGPPQRVIFEPTVSRAVSTMLGRAIEVLPTERLLWWFVLGLAIPVARMGGGLRLLGVFLSAHVAVLLWVALRPSPLTDLTVDVVQFALGSAVALAAVQTLAGSSPRAMGGAAVVAGMASAGVLGRRVHEWVPLAGAHSVVSMVAVSALVVALAVGWLVLLRPLVRLPYQWAAPAWLVTAAWAAIPAHAASHTMIDAASRFSDVDRAALRPAVQFLLVHGSVLALVAFLGVLTLVAWTAKRSGAKPGRTAPV